MLNRIKMRLLLKLFIGLLVPITTAANASAPQCSHVFMSFQIEQAIASLAEMRLHIDLANVNGSGTSVVARFFENQYPKKYNEVLQVVKSESLLKQLIKTEIQKLQNREDNSIQIENAVRSQEHESIKSHKLTKRVNLGFKSSLSRSITMDYLPNVHALVTQKEAIIYQKTVIVDTRTGQLFEPLGPKEVELQSRVSPSGNELIVLTKKDIVTYDILNKKILSRIALTGEVTKIFSQKVELSWSPSRTKVAFVTKAGLSVLDIATGISELLVPKKDLKGRLFHVTYMNESELFLASGHDHINLIYNTSTMQSRDVNNPDLRSGDLFVSSTGSLTFVNPWTKTAYLLDQNTLATVARAPYIKESQIFNSSALIFDKTQFDAMIFDFKSSQQDWMTIKHFADTYSHESSPTIEGLWIKDKDVYVQLNDKGQRYVDIWLDDSN